MFDWLFILQVSALVVAVIAILFEISFLNDNVFLKQDWKSPPVLVAIACIIIGVVSLFGCCGVIRESRSCLIVVRTLVLFYSVTAGLICKVVSR